ncbi:hypothetical protein NEOLEDRAFT_1135739 [Neolentinus lepideus HHB14362 ss-1]|uniref:Uncharacterized protein n=1 Tax=Neolentinus lepideus HHB14362 ss-1 TaxID=1314782 RepID=A0A165RJK1_9AGAM|nr:hypothetical protein NEOLEDRAFT_1135739 [Neolentinus lepideus HHB14362 ss-1]
MPSPMNGVRMREWGVGRLSIHSRCRCIEFHRTAKIPIHQRTPRSSVSHCPSPYPPMRKRSPSYELVQEIRLKLVMPAVCGRERGDMNCDMLGDGGFVRGKIWEAECHIYEEW